MRLRGGLVMADPSVRRLGRPVVGRLKNRLPTTAAFFAILLPRAPPGESAERQVILSVGIPILRNVENAADIDMLAVAREFREGV